MKKVVISILLFLICFLFPSISHSSFKFNEVKDIRYWSSNEYTRVVLVLASSVKYSKNQLNNPSRLYFDLKNTRLNGFGKKSIKVKDGTLKRIRIGYFNRSTVRIVLDLDKYKDYRVYTLSSPDRVVVDIYGRKEKLVFPSKKIIVIDPGHGGRDPGAIGRRGLKEKDVVLDVAKKLAKILSKNYFYDVYLTRGKDVYLPLDERTVIANGKNADLFISIHANASPHRDVGGIETYLLNWTNDKEAIRVAARENAISVKKMKEAQTELGMILSSLARDSKRDESLRLAHYIQKSMVSHLNGKYGELNNLGVKQALFYVLVGASMPSVLVEVSFISNPYEERLLAKHHYRNSLASSIAKGIHKYVAGLPDTPRFVKR